MEREGDPIKSIFGDNTSYCTVLRYYISSYCCMAKNVSGSEISLRTLLNSTLLYEGLKVFFFVWKFGKKEVSVFFFWPEVNISLSLLWDYEIRQQIIGFLIFKIGNIMHKCSVNSMAHFAFIPQKLALLLEYSTKILPVVTNVNLTMTPYCFCLLLMRNAKKASKCKVRNYSKDEWSREGWVR